MINLLFSNDHWILVLAVLLCVAGFCIALTIEPRLDKESYWRDDYIDPDDDDDDDDDYDDPDYGDENGPFWPDDLPDEDESIVLVPTAIYTPLSESRLAYETGDLTDYSYEHVAKLLAMEADVRHFMTRQDLETQLFIHEMAA